MAAGSLNLPAGTEVTKLIAFPLSGSWCGLTRVRIATHTSAATLHEWIFIWANAPSNRTYYRRTATSSSNNWYNSTLAPDTDHLRWLSQNESLMKITYTASQEISVVFETTRSILPAPGAQAQNLSQWNKHSATGDMWDSGNGQNNLTPNNPTEIRVGDINQLNGVGYWRPTT
jgi:hypothetical protein